MADGSRPRVDDVTCPDARVAISVALDGEAAVTPAPAVVDHLAGCVSCRRFEERAVELHRRVRVSPAPVVPDLQDRIVAAATAAVPRKRHAATARQRDARVVLGLAGVVQVVVALAGLFGANELHAVREVAAFEVALGAAMVIGAWRPGRFARGMLPLLGLAALVVLGAAVADVLGGVARPVAEFSHLVPAVGAILLWWLAHGSPPSQVRTYAGTA